MSHVTSAMEDLTNTVELAIDDLVESEAAVGAIKDAHVCDTHLPSDIIGIQSSSWPVA